MNKEVLVDQLQRDSFSYFLHELNPENGLIKDKTAANWAASIAATGFALAAYPIGVERGVISRAEAALRTLNALRFFWNSPQGSQSDASGYKGFYYHFLDMQTGRRVGNCELSTVDTAFLIAGALVAGIYFDAESEEELEIRKLAKALYLRVDWQWAQNRQATLTHGWRPRRGFLKHRWEGYDEALLLYILALGSPTYALPESAYQAWTKTYKWIEYAGEEYLYAGPLFAHQFSHLWIDFRAIQDDYMRAKGSNYFENSRRATYAQYKYANNNPLGFAGYGQHCWGISASDGPGRKTINIKGHKSKFFGYCGRAIPYGPDDGTLSPWSVIASLPFAPEIVLPAIQYLTNQNNLNKNCRYGFKAAYNHSYPVSDLNFWTSPYDYGINQGPAVLMIENYRSELLWKLMRQCPYIVNGLMRAGFKGGWLEGTSKN